MGKRQDIESGKHKPRPPPPPPPQPWCSWLIPLVFLANLGMFGYSMYLNDCPSKVDIPQECVLYDSLGRYSFEPRSVNPLFGPSVSTLRDLGGLDRKLVQHGQAWRLMSCIWLHAGVIHLLANIFSLLFIGIRLEEEFGFLKIGILYLFSGLGGSLMSCLQSRGPTETISVGASGALFGLLGAMLSELITNWSIYENKCSALFTLVLVIALNLGVGFLPNVDNSAHIGGFLAGYFLGFVLLLRPQYGYVSRKYIPAGYDVKHKKSKYKCCQYFLCVTALIILFFGYSVGFAKVLRGETVDYRDLQKLM